MVYATDLKFVLIKGVGSSPIVSIFKYLEKMAEWSKALVC